MHKHINSLILLILILSISSFSKDFQETKRSEVRRNHKVRSMEQHWSEIDWWTLYGDADDEYRFITMENVKNFNGVKNNGWDMTFWYDSSLGIKGEETSVTINDIENTITFLKREFDKQGNVIEVIDSAVLVYDMAGVLKEYYWQENDKVEYFINNTTNLIDSTVFYSYNELTEDWEMDGKEIFTYKEDDLLTYANYTWTNGSQSWHENFNERYVYNSAGLLDSLIEDYGSQYISIYSYSEDYKSDTCLEYKKSFNPDDVRLMYKFINTKDSNDRDSAWTFYMYDADLDSFFADDQIVYTYTNEGNIKEYINVEYVDSVDQFIPTWKEEYIYDDQNKPIGFKNFICEDGQWIDKEDVFTVSFKGSTPISFSNFKNFPDIQNIKVVQNSTKYSLVFNTKNKNLKNMKLFDMKGRLIKSLKPTYDGNKVSYNLNKEFVSKGRIYLLMLNVDGKNYTRSLLLK